MGDSVFLPGAGVNHVALRVVVFAPSCLCRAPAAVGCPESSSAQRGDRAATATAAGAARAPCACTGLWWKSPEGLWGVTVVAMGVHVLPAAGGFSVTGEGTHQPLSAGKSALLRTGWPPVVMAVSPGIPDKLRDQLVTRTHADPN